jgi:hypothetical protein
MTNRRELAELKMRLAKARFTRAAIATLDGLPLAAVMSEIALLEIQQARAELRALDRESSVHDRLRTDSPQTEGG